MYREVLWRICRGDRLPLYAQHLLILTIWRTGRDFRESTAAVLAGFITNVFRRQAIYLSVITISWSWMTNADNSMAAPVLGEKLANTEKKAQMSKVAKLVFHQMTIHRFCGTAKLIHASFWGRKVKIIWTEGLQSLTWTEQQRASNQQLMPPWQSPQF